MKAAKRQKKNLPDGRSAKTVLPLAALVEVDGFEPTAFCLQSRHSTN